MEGESIVVENEVIYEREDEDVDSLHYEGLVVRKGERHPVDGILAVERAVVARLQVGKSTIYSAEGTNIIVGNVQNNVDVTIRDRSKREIQFGTEGRVRTAAFIKLVRILQARSRSWSVISGWPGEGKTTLGYFLLQKFWKEGFEVYIIKTKEEYFNINKFGKNIVVMLDDIFGSLAFELESLNNWLNVLSDLEQMIQRDEGQQIHVIITMRNYIVKAAIPHLGGLASLFQNEKFIIDISEQFPLSFLEKKHILRRHLKQRNVSIPQEKITQICQLSVHGFPQCCKLFSDISEAHYDPKRFFINPVVFLNQTVFKLIKNPLVRRLFYLILANDGKVEKRSYVGNHFFESISRDEIIEASHDLIGSYLIEVGGTLMFSHPSILWSIVFVIGCRDLEFIIQVCPLSIMKEIVVLPNVESKGYLTITAQGPCVEALTKRFVKEIESECLQTVLSSEAFSCESFAKDVISRLRKRWHILELQDFSSRKTFLHFVCSSKSNVLLKLISEEHNFTESQLKHLVLGCAENGSQESFIFIRENYPDLNLNIRDEQQRTPLHKAAESGNKGLVEFLFPHLDVMAVDFPFRMTALHCASEAGHKEVCEYLVEHDCIVNCQDSVGRTPLHFAAWSGHKDIVCLLIVKGADVNMADIDNGTPLHDSCFRGYDGVADTLIEHGCDINVQNDWGESPICVAASHGYTDVVRRLLRAGCDTSLKNQRSETAEDIARRYKYTETIQAFEDYRRMSAAVSPR